MQSRVILSSADLESARCRLVEQELLALGIGHNDSLGMLDRVVGQVHLFLCQAPHENRVPATGALLLSHSIDEYDFDGCERIDIPPSLPHRWRLADGTRSFIAIDGEREVLLMFRRPLTDELGLFSLRDDVLFKATDQSPSDPITRECVVVKRDEQHSRSWLTVLAKEKIVTYSRGRFTGKHYQYETLAALRRACDPFPWTQPNEQQTLRSALRIATHILSPQGCGGTLVLLSPADTPRLEDISREEFTERTSVSLPPLLVRNRAHQYPIAHAVSQTDGAAIIDHTGVVRQIGTFFTSLRSSADGALSTSRTSGGSRHESAQAFSEKIAGIVVVISADGPVSIFHRGRLVVVDGPAESPILGPASHAPART